MTKLNYFDLSADSGWTIKYYFRLLLLAQRVLQIQIQFQIQILAALIGYGVLFSAILRLVCRSNRAQMNAPDITRICLPITEH